MKLIYTHDNRLLVENAKNLLLNAGINPTVKNEYAAGGAGDLAPSETWLELWVDEQSVQQAMLALAPLHEQCDGTWHCAHCGEQNAGNFEVCWQCQHPHQ